MHQCPEELTLAFRVASPCKLELSRVFLATTRLVQLHFHSRHRFSLDPLVISGLIQLDPLVSLALQETRLKPKLLDAGIGLL